MTTETLAYCPRDSAHGKWLNWGGNCPCQPKTRFVVIGKNGLSTEAFDMKQINLLIDLDLVAYHSTIQFENGSNTHYYKGV